MLFPNWIKSYRVRPEVVGSSQTPTNVPGLPNKSKVPRGGKQVIYTFFFFPFSPFTTMFSEVFYTVCSETDTPVHETLKFEWKFWRKEKKKIKLLRVGFLRWNEVFRWSPNPILRSTMEKIVFSESWWVTQFIFWRAAGVLGACFYKKNGRLEQKGCILNNKAFNLPDQSILFQAALWFLSVGSFGFGLTWVHRFRHGTKLSAQLF